MSSKNLFLKKRRQELGLTLKDVAAKVGVSESLISRYESGEVENMGLNKIKLYAEILRVNPMAFINGFNISDINKYIYKIEPMLKKIKLSKENKKELIEELNLYIKEHNLENEPINYDIPFNENTTDYELLDFLYAIDENRVDTILSSNTKIRDIQKDIIDKTNKIDDVNEIEYIRNIVDLSYNKFKNSSNIINNNDLKPLETHKKTHKLNLNKDASFDGNPISDDILKQLEEDE